MKEQESRKKQKENVADIENEVYQLVFEESYRIEDMDVMIYLLKSHFYDLGFEDIYVLQLLSKFKKGFQEGNEHAKKLFVKKYLSS